MKRTLCKHIKQRRRRIIDYGKAGIHQFFCDTVGQKRLPHAYAAVQKEIFVLLIKGSDKILTDRKRILHDRQRGAPGLGVNIIIRIVFHGKRIKILGFENFLQVGLLIKETAGSRLKAAALLIVDIARIPALGTLIGGLQIIGREAAGLQQLILLLPEDRKLAL